MPKILVNEIDNTSGASSASALTNTVYIPGAIAQTITYAEQEYTFKALATGHTESELLPHLVTSVAELDALIEDFNAVYSRTDTPAGGGEPVESTQEAPVAPNHGM